MENIPLKIGEKGEKMGWSVNYFANLGVECHFSKIGCRESSFPKRMGCPYNLPKYYLEMIVLHSKLIHTTI